MIVDTYHVTHGTDQKAFDVDRAELEKDYTQSNARDFFYDYKDKPLSFILKNSRNIFSEGYYGYGFYYDVINSRIINPLQYKIELDKVDSYMKDAKARGISTAQQEMYEKLHDLIQTKIDESSHLSNVFKRANVSMDGADEYFEKLFDVLDTFVPLSQISNIADSIFDVKEPYVAIPAGYFFCMKYPKYSDRLSGYCRIGFNVDHDDPDNVRKAARINACIKEMMMDEDVPKNISDMKDINLFNTWTKCVDTSNCMNVKFNEMMESVMESVSDTLLDSDMMSSVNPFTAATLVTESADIDHALTRAHYESASDMKTLLDIYMEFASEDIRIGIRKKDDADYALYEDAEDELTTEMAILEWEDDGTPNRVIRKQIMTSDERKRESEEEKRKESDDPTDISEEDALSEIREAEKKINSLKNKDGMTEEKFDSESDKIKIELSKLLHKAVFNYPEVSSALNKLDMIDFYESFNEDAAPAKPIDGTDIPSDANPNGKHPKKPKVGFIRKVQNKALDTDAKLRKKEAIAGEKIDELKSAGKALSYHPKMIEDKVDTTISKFDKWDDNRRKEFLLKPGYRHKIFKKFRVVLEYGLASKIKLSFVPILWSIRHLSKLKDKRIRNELSLELDNEIKICEEKISDASAKGDNEKKYELMRIKDKLDAERTRVRLNSKYV